MTDKLTLTAGIDRSLAWAEGSSVRYFAATLEACKSTNTVQAPRPPVHLAIVIDASGSMSGDKLHNARTAALGVAERLRGGDLLSVVSFASDVIIHADGVALNEASRPIISAAIAGLEVRGNTDLSGGWLVGAECVARSMQPNGVNRIILLSDGHANQGITDLEQLAVHAAELARRGISTSTVGIGDGYDEATLQAIASHGGGRLHDAEHGVEIIETLMGELGEIGNIAAQNVTLTLMVSATAQAALVGSTPVTVGAGTLSVFAGALLDARPRRFVFRVTLPKGRLGETLHFGLRASGTTPEGVELEVEPLERAVTFADSARNSRQPRDEAITMMAAQAWHADILRTASRMNRGEDRRHLAHYIERELRFFERYCNGLPGSLDLLREIVLLKQNAGRVWTERTRKEIHLSAGFAEEAAFDFRSAPRAHWSQRLQDGT